MHAEYWPVGASHSDELPLSLAEIAAHLKADWLPSLPADVSNTLFGWPPFALESILHNGVDTWSIHERMAQTERQWKSVFSWMLGVAGTRQVLKQEDYRWIAPLSAFYSSAINKVDLSDWNPEFPQSRLIAQNKPSSKSRLMPDYLAIRSSAHTTNKPKVTVVEAKGTKRCLTNLSSCPKSWKAQVHNVELFLNKEPLQIHRHMVVATRINPNATRSATRRLQVRAWNRQDDSTETRLPGDLNLEIATASLFGLFRNLGLRETARAIAMSVEARRVEGRLQKLMFDRPAVQDTAEKSDNELKQMGSSDDEESSIVRSSESSNATIEAQISGPTIRLTRRLIRESDRTAAVEILREGDQELDHWEQIAKEKQPDSNFVSLPIGVSFRADFR